MKIKKTLKILGLSLALCSAAMLTAADKQITKKLKINGQEMEIVQEGKGIFVKDPKNKKLVELSKVIKRLESDKKSKAKAVQSPIPHARSKSITKPLEVVKVTSEAIYVKMSNGFNMPYYASGDKKLEERIKSVKAKDLVELTIPAPHPNPDMQCDCLHFEDFKVVGKK